MSLSKHKLVRAISAEELDAFLEELAGVPDVTGQKIRDLAEEKFGVEMGHDAANNFRRDVFGSYLSRMRDRKEMTRRILDVKDASTGHTLADAASEELQQQVFEFMMNSRLDLGNDEDLERAEKLSRIIKGARAEDRKMIEDLRESLARAQEEKKAMVSAAQQKGASPELIAAIRQASNFRPPSSAPVQQAS